MKPLLLIVFLSIQSLVYAQIAFEEITSPVDFSIRAIRQSPGGEYFVQAINDRNSIFTSMNGHDWTRTLLAEAHPLEDIQFYSDGTPVLKADNYWHLIRRDDAWYSMDVPGAYNKVDASFIQRDTLFVFQDEIFAYSIDKGYSFTELFTATGINAHSAHLWMFENLLILHHTIGATDYLSVYTKDGTRLFYQSLGIGIRDYIYNTCGQLLLGDYDSYFLFKADVLSLTSMLISNIFPDFSDGSELFSRNGIYYARDKSTIYRTTGCDFTWESVSSDELVDTYEKIWVNDQGDVFLYNTESDFFIRQTNGSNTWENNLLEIDYANISGVDESPLAHQVALTSNALFSKTLSNTEWSAANLTGENNTQVQYSPDGGLYVNRGADIQYSADNGISFNTITLPAGQFPPASYIMEVLSDDILFILDDKSGESYYSLNNGQDWIGTIISFQGGLPLVRLVDNYIIVAQTWSFRYTVSRINLATNETTSEELGDFISLDFYGSAIMEDGTIYFQAWDLNGTDPEGLFRYRFGEGLEFLGQFDELTDVNTFSSSGNDLYAFTYDRYYVFNGETLEEHTYTGLPVTNVTSFCMTENQYVYAIIGNHRLFRSSRPLSFPQFISGYVYHDSNKDCQQDTTEATLKYWQVRIENDQYLRIKATDSHGRFNFNVPIGEYTVSSNPVNSSWALCESSYNVTIDENIANVSRDFQAQGVRDCADVQIDFSTPLLRRCFDNFYSVRIHNTGPEATAGTVLTMELDPFFEFSSATIPYTLEGDSIVKFDLGIIAVNDIIYFKIFFNLSCDAGLGIEHCVTGILTDDNICGGDRSSYVECQENIGSYDPNDKRVFNEAGDEAERIDKGEYIYYHIRFQNTGTDTAFNIRVVDPLSPKLDLSTLEMLSASHAYEYFISDGPELVVLFDDVLLADSTTNEPASHGFFKFRIKPLAEFDYGTSIPNVADIYFDFNEPVITNEAIMFILPPVGTKEIKDLLEFNVFPNPASNVLNITFGENDGIRIDAYEIMDYQGRRITQSAYSNNKTITVAHLAPGIYNLMLREKGSVVGMKKFVRL